MGTAGHDDDARNATLCRVTTFSPALSQLDITLTTGMPHRTALDALATARSSISILGAAAALVGFSTRLEQSALSRHVDGLIGRHARGEVVADL